MKTNLPNCLKFLHASPKRSNYHTPNFYWILCKLRVDHFPKTPEILSLLYNFYFKSTTIIFGKNLKHTDMNNKSFILHWEAKSQMLTQVLNNKSFAQVKNMFEIEFGGMKLCHPILHLRFWILIPKGYNQAKRVRNKLVLTIFELQQMHDLNLS